MRQSARVDLNLLHAFYWVAKAGSFTRAARALHAPKSTISRQIRVLETRLATRLIERTTRKLALTEMGRLYFEHCERVIAEAEEAEGAVHAHQSEPRGLLRVGVPVTFARTFLSPLLPSFCTKHPHVNLELVIPGRADLIDNLLDLVIRIGRIADSSYVVRKLGSIPQALFASQQYLSRNPAPIEPEEIAKHSVISITRTPGGTRWRLVNREGQEKAAQFEPRVSASDPVVAYQLAVSGLGIASVPAFMWREDANLVRVLPDWNPYPVDIFALYPERRLVSPKVRAFLQHLEANLQF